MRKTFFLIIVAILFFGCEKKIDFSTLPKDENISVNDTSYIEITPAFYGFTQISDIQIGGDQLIYVCDYEANKIFQLNLAGIKIGETNLVFHPKSIAQDSRLDLLICGEVIENNDTIASIFRIKISNIGFSLSNINVNNIDTIWKEKTNPERRFSDIIVVSENQYIVARTGPNNSSPIDPDSRLLWFKKTDSLITPIPDLQTGIGNAITFLNKPTGLISFPYKKDFIVTQFLDGVNYGAIWMAFLSSSDFIGWIPKFDPSNPLQRVDFVLPNQFFESNGGTADPNREDIFILTTPSLSNEYVVKKFDKKGKFKNESIKSNSIFPPILKPIAATFSNKIIFIAEKNRIVRFKLSTDFNN